jgi:2,4-dienoyl-CoA reductase-like NADH-dependent reductase (Old Yellow Enzyme family)
MKTKLFSPLKLRDLELKNRIAVSPMCQYSAENGVPNSWHLVHLGSHAVGGAGLVFCEATAVSPEGRISPADTGLWNEEQIQAFSEITEFIKAQNSVPGVQIAHAGRKASTPAPWEKQIQLNESHGGWTPIAPSPIPFDDKSQVPREMTVQDLEKVSGQFIQATKNALKAGFQVVEIHMAHGYLLNEFLSPLSNLRKDDFGGSLENRMKFPLRIAAEIRKVWPTTWPVFTRISVTDWVEGGWTLEDSIIFSKRLKMLGIDLIDCSSGGSSPHAKIKAGPGYQVPFAEGVRKGAQMATGAVGIIVDPHQAEEILKSGQADLILMARELLRDPYWPLHAASILQEEVQWPKQYERAKR